ncbi:MAG: hypothetical protein IJT16_08085 [Lachnospiraceae bacterium]|nr:hypothetical protein [Lachnospiraceae bacterium]
MNDLTLEETITMLYGMLWAGGLERSEREIIEAAIGYLEKGEEDEQ